MATMERVVKEDVPLPQAWGVLYAKPNPDGSRKNCKNCWKFSPSEGMCLEFSKDIAVTPDSVCGLHVYGTPTDKWVDHGQNADPKTNGLGLIKGGTACIGCRFYRHWEKARGMGLCYAVANGSEPPAKPPPTPVDDLGCCSRWEDVDPDRDARDVEPAEPEEKPKEPEEPMTESAKIENLLRGLKLED